MSELPIVIVGGHPDARHALEQALTRRGYSVKMHGRDYQTIEAAMVDAIDIVLVVLPSPDPGTALLQRVSSQPGAPPIIVVGTDEGVPGPAEAFALGAQDFIEGPEDIARLMEALGLALGASRRDSQLRFLRNREASGADWQTVVGDCEAMRATMALVKQITTRTARGAAPPILITGETGTGKGLIARCIHYNSVRRNEPLIDVNCAAIPATLIESELFGHERGAFTDAKTARAGLFETADRGSLFLDEIASLTPDLQAKLLIATEEKRVRRIGGRESKTIDVQLIAATHRNLREMVESGEFREDFFHRLNVLSVHLPPLRKRDGDKIRLAEKFINAMCREYDLPPRQLSARAKEAVVAYGWPGNVRELKNQIERIVLLVNERVIEPEHFQFLQGSEVSLKNSTDRIEVNLPETSFSLEQLEVEVMRKALRKFDGNVSQAARYLQITRQTLIYRMRKHGIEAETSRPD